MHDMPHDAQREVPHNTPHGGQREVPHGAPHVTQREVSPDLRRDDPASVFAGVRAQFDAASRVAGGVVTRACRVAGHRITLQFAGDALVEHLTRALAHVIAAAEDEEQVGTTSLTIRIWHRDSTRDVAPLLPAWWWRDSSMRGQPQAYHGGRFHTAVHADTLVYNTKRSGTFVLGGRTFRLRRVAFPERPTAEWFVVDLLEHANAAGVSRVDVVEALDRALAAGRFDAERLRALAGRYAGKVVRAMLEPLLSAPAP